MREIKLMLAFTALILLSVQQATAADSAVGGLDHVGLTVTDLVASEAFFVDVLDFSVVRRDADYPASFVKNGDIVVTLWRTLDPITAVQFDRKNNVGLHHLALKIDGFEALDGLYAELLEAPGVIIEFAPEPLSGGPTRHMMIREPSGNRLEFIHRPPSQP